MLGSTKFLAEELGRIDPDHWKYRIKPAGLSDRSFCITITATQQTRPGVKQDIETWYALNSTKLPENGATIHINLDEVRIV
jgi:hypothetical protein